MGVGVGVDVGVGVGQGVMVHVVESFDVFVLYHLHVCRN